MSSTIIVDASVVIKWLINEDHSPNAVALLRDATHAGTVLTAPPLLPSEVANAIYQRFRRRDIPADEADSAVARLGQFDVAITDQTDLYHDAYSFTRLHQLPAVYDSHYVVLARALDTEFWTDDRRLLNRLHPVAPWVRWIGDYPLNNNTAP